MGGSIERLTAIDRDATRTPTDNWTIVSAARPRPETDGNWTFCGFDRSPPGAQWYPYLGAWS